MAKKSINRFKNKVTVGLIIGSISIIGLLFFVSLSRQINEQGQVSTLRSSMRDLHSSFNTIDNGWTYDEFCKPSGSDISRNNRIICFISLANMKRLSHQSYDSLILKNSVIQKRRGDESYQTSNSGDASVSYYTYGPRNSSDRLCELRSNDIEMNFSCYFESTTYTFVRRD